jgi:hypothetical protein
LTLQECLEFFDVELASQLPSPIILPNQDKTSYIILFAALARILLYFVCGGKLLPLSFNSRPRSTKVRITRGKLDP